MKRLTIALLTILLTSGGAAKAGDITTARNLIVNGVGISSLSRTIYINVFPNIVDSGCDRVQQVRISLDENEFAEMFLRTALGTASVSITYEKSRCLLGAPEALAIERVVRVR